MLEQVPDYIRKAVKETNDVSTIAEMELKRGKLFRSCCDLYREGRGTNIGKALSLYFHLDKNFAEELSTVRASKGDSMFDKAFSRAKEFKVYTRAAAPVDADSYNAQDDISDTLVEKSIADQIEKESAIMQYIWTKQGEGYKDVKFPKLTTTAAATYKAKAATLDDFSDGTSMIGGLSHITVEPEKIGATMDFLAEAFIKLDPMFVSELIDKMKKLYMRGVHQAIYTGDGNTPNPLGFAVNATAITWAGTSAQTIQKMIATVGDKDKAATGLFLVTNMAGASAIAAEKLNNEAFDANISLSGEGKAGNVMGIPIVIDQAIITSGASPAVTAPLYLGAKDRYAFVNGSNPQIVTDEYNSFKAGTQSVRIMAINGGKPIFNDSFAKTTIPAVY